jgi:hypothetical protein
MKYLQDKTKKYEFEVFNNIVFSGDAYLEANIKQMPNNIRMNIIGRFKLVELTRSLRKAFYHFNPRKN